jgi:hypothetical protein
MQFDIKEFIVEIVLVVILIGLSMGLLDIYLMPMGMQFVLFVALMALFAAFAVFFWREQGGDERETSLIHQSDRIGFLIGSFILLLGIVVEGLLFHMVDPWTTGALALMVIGKMCSYIYYQHKK